MIYHLKGSYSDWINHQKEIRKSICEILVDDKYRCTDEACECKFKDR